MSQVRCVRSDLNLITLTIWELKNGLENNGQVCMNVCKTWAEGIFLYVMSLKPTIKDSVGGLCFPRRPYCIREKVFLKSVWHHSVIDYYDKAQNTPYFEPWQLGEKLGVYRWPQCNYKKRFYKSHSRLSKITTGNRCRNRWTMQNLTNRNLKRP